jgi:hypothetical protein
MSFFRRNFFGGDNNSLLLAALAEFLARVALVWEANTTAAETFRETRTLHSTTPEKMES